MQSGEIDHELAHWPPSDGVVRCPFAFMAGARERAPIVKFASPNELGHPMYLVTGHEECAYILSHHHEFGSNLAGVMPGFTKSAVPLPFPEIPTFHEQSVVFFSGGDDHRIKRKWSMELVSPARIRGWLPALSRLMDQTIDGFAGKTCCDFRKEFSDIFPVKALTIILSLPPEGEAVLRRVSRIIAKTDMDPAISPEDEAEKIAAMGALFMLNRSMLEQRFAAPGDDYVSTLARTQAEQDGTLDVNALSIHLQGIEFGGDHAVGAYFAYLVAELATRPDIQDRLRQDPALIDSFVLETLRIDPPIPWLFRKCEVETHVAGQVIPQGAVMVVASVAANRDPAIHPDPDALRLDRDKLERTILSFGRGAHRCLGEPLARAMGALLIERMLARFAEIRLDAAQSDLEPPLSYQFRCPERVHLLLTPRT
ncbi:MAG: cytochrome P450 [Novosphingobium sp.]|jgi:cytochrome P450|nr:cytochrome P450 [Novosphingobium sp.]